MSLTTIKNMMDEFSVFSGLQVNTSKSSVLLLIVCANEQVELREILGYERANYLLNIFACHELVG